MLFNSPEFLLLFLPLAVCLFVQAGRFGIRTQVYVLAAISLVFYSFWKIEYLGILLSNIVVVFSIGKWMSTTRSAALRTTLVCVGVFFCLSVLGYYKYAHFVTYNLSLFMNVPVAPENTIPLGLSFYTFTTIAFLVDIYRREIDRLSIGEYAATITYFPHLVAGPILYHHDTIPQFRGEPHRFTSRGFYLFLIFFSIGLMKKIGLADNIARYSDPIFTAVEHGAIPDTGQAWRAAICYTLQLYFDFSGYSDMAVGIANLFGVRIPVNFFSPYKSLNIADFWRRWHISLGYFLRVYLYFPLGGSRGSLARTLFNLFTVFFLCGIWHGAGWTFVVWGMAHGLGLIVHRLWREFGPQLPASTGGLVRAATSLLSMIVTFVFVTACWVVFKAQTLDAAWVILKAMVSDTGHHIPHLFNFYSEIAIAALMAVVWLFPNLYQLMDRYEPGINLYKNQGRSLVFEGKGWQQVSLGLAAGTMFALAFALMLINGQSAYLYFEF